MAPAELGWGGGGGGKALVSGTLKEETFFAASLIKLIGSRFLDIK